MTNLDQKLSSIKDTIACQTAQLDQTQTHLNTHRHLMSEDEAWGIQAEIDRLRFDVEIDRLQVKTIITNIK